MCESGMCRVSELYQNAPCYCMFCNASRIEPVFWRLGGFLSPRTWHLSSGSRSACGQGCAFFLSSSRVFTDSILPVKNMFAVCAHFSIPFIARSAFTFEVHFKKKIAVEKALGGAGLLYARPWNFLIACESVLWQEEWRKEEGSKVE